MQHHFTQCYETVLNLSGTTFSVWDISQSFFILFLVLTLGLTVHKRAMGSLRLIMGSLFGNFKREFPSVDECIGCQ